MLSRSEWIKKWDWTLLYSRSLIQSFKTMERSQWCIDLHWRLTMWNPISTRMTRWWDYQVLIEMCVSRRWIKTSSIEKYTWLCPLNLRKCRICRKDYVWVPEGIPLLKENTIDQWIRDRWTSSSVFRALSTMRRSQCCLVRGPSSTRNWLQCFRTGSEDYRLCI